MTEIAEGPQEKEVTRRPSYTTADIERALVEVAACNGNTRQAAANLEVDKQATSVPRETLYHWQRSIHRERYEAIRAEMLPKIREQAADQHMSLAERNMEAEGLLIDRLKTKANELDARDLPGAIRNLSVGSAVHTEKAQLLNDQPTERRAIDLSGTLQELKSLGVEAKHVMNLEPVSEEDVDETEAQSLSGSGGSDLGPSGLADSPG